MNAERIAESVMRSHGMTSLDEFGTRMTMGEMRRMLVQAAELGHKAQKERDDDNADA